MGRRRRARAAGVGTRVEGGRAPRGRSARRFPLHKPAPALPRPSAAGEIFGARGAVPRRRRQRRRPQERGGATRAERDAISEAKGVGRPLTVGGGV